MNLQCTYLGLPLGNPIVVGACPLTSRLDDIVRVSQAGAGALVLRSLFEEEIRRDTEALDDCLSAAEAYHTEAQAYLSAELSMRYGTHDYLALVRQAKEAVDIPVIASINCSHGEWWEDFAAETAAAGADALELNIAVFPRTPLETPDEIEARCEEIVRAACRAVHVPVAVKLAANFANVTHTMLRLRQAGASGFVLFNRLYRPTVDVERMVPYAGYTEWLSSPAELSTSLRWLAFSSGAVGADLAAATGVHTGEDIVRAILVGADVVQCVTTVLANGLERIGEMKRDLATWMKRHQFQTLTDFRGRLSVANNPEAETFGRLQYVRSLMERQGRG